MSNAVDSREGKGPVIVRQEDLPIPLVVVGKNGDAMAYQINRAGKKKLGACLGKPDR